MEHRQLGGSGLRVPALSFGTATFSAGAGAAAWGNTEVDQATRLIDIALDAGVNFFDTVDAYSGGRAEEVLSAAIGGRRDKVLVGTKATAPPPGTTDVNDVGSSRHHLVRSLEGSLRRLGTDYIDVLPSPVRRADTAGRGLEHPRPVRPERGGPLHRVLELLRLAAHEVALRLEAPRLGPAVWSPLAQSRLTGKIRRGRPAPADSRLRGRSQTEHSGDEETLFRTVDVLDQLAEETGKTIPQVALNWVLQRPTVSSVVFGARDERQLRENVGAVGWNLTPEQVARLDRASATTPIYPYWHQLEHSQERNPFPTDVRPRSDDPR
jgi:aryl-alcohol dehydrogenase-like predicted oxidoreductase